jgi:RNA polymerase sigma factor (sigma-70 family)
MRQDGERVAELVRAARDPSLSLRRRHADFTTLVERFQAMALAVAREASDDPESSRDACQNAFLIAWRSLHRLRDAEAFGGWLKRLVRSECARARRRSAVRSDDLALAEEADPSVCMARRETHHVLSRVVRDLPTAEREAVTLVYFQGETLEEAGRRLGVTPAQAGKLVYRARLRLRRSLPREIARAFLAAAPSPRFTRSVEAGMLDELQGAYRFPERPDQPVVLRRERGMLVADAGGQTNVLTSRRADRIAAIEFDGEACFQRDGQGRITGFVYYEFGQRLGVAWRVAPPPREVAAASRSGDRGRRNGDRSSTVP